MKAARLVAPRRFEILDVPEPSLSQPDTLLVRVERASLCGSDSPYFLRNLGNYPAPVGLSIHECIGWVVDSKSPRFRIGDAVLAVPPGQMGLTELFVANAAHTVPLPSAQFSSEILMAQPLGTVLWAMRKLPNLLHAHTVVLGQGPMGLLLDATLSNLGAKSVIAVDRIPQRLAVAPAMRATHLLNANQEDVAKRVREITEGHMADLVVEAVGHQTESLNTSLSLVRHGGTILAFGVPDDEVYPFNFKEFYHRNLRLIGSVSPEPSKDYPLAMDMIVQRRIDVRPLLTHELPFDEVQRAFELFTERKEGAIKVVLRYP